MAGNSKSHGTTAPPTSQDLCSLRRLEQSHRKHRLAGTQEALLGLWEASLDGATQQLVWVLCTRHNPAVLFPAPPHTRGKLEEGRLDCA
jgi:hypothetical protein